MKTETKNRLLVSGLLLCLIGLLAQSLYLWRLERTLAAGADNNLPDRIQQRLDAIAGSAPVADPLDIDSWIGPAFPVDPFSRMQQMQQQMNSIFSTFGAPAFPGFSGTSISGNSPTLMLEETDSEYQVNVQTPPNEELTIDTELEENLLVVSGTSTRKQSVGGSSFSSRSQFSRSFDLPKPVDALGIYSEAYEGGLRIHVPKK